MGACLPKSPSCGEVRPNTKLFNVCCGGQVIIERSEVDGKDGENNREEPSEKVKKLLKKLWIFHWLIKIFLLTIV